MPVFLTALLAAMGVLGAAWLGGRALAPQLKPSLSFGLGAMAISYAIFGLMITRQASLPALAVVLGLAFAAGLLKRPRFDLELPPLWTLLVCAPFACWYGVNALAPEVNTDPNVYHLRPAADSLRFGGFSKVIDFYDRLPHALEMLFIPAWRIGGSSAAKLVHLGFLLATLPLIVQIARLFGFPEKAGLASAALYFVTPVVGTTGSSAFNDAALVYFSLAAVALALENRPGRAGLTAGFCYAVKMTGLIAVPVVMVCFVLRKQFRRAVYAGIAAVLPCLPWLLRNWAQTGNPLAPFLNAWFPNPYFYVWTEQALTRHLRDYGVPFLERIPELLAGSRLQGMIGPVFVLAPLALLAVRKRDGWAPLALAAIFSIPWWMNAGARFTMVSIPFLALALCIAIPARAIPALLALHVVASWPMFVAIYNPAVFQLREFPLHAALRIESEDDYLFRSSYDYRYVKMVEQGSPPNARILDVWGMPTVYSAREFTGTWRSAQTTRLLEALDFAQARGMASLQSTRASFPAAPICGFRVTLSAAMTAPWTLNLLEARHRSVRVQTGAPRFVSSSRMPWEIPLALDANPVSRWSSGQAGQAGDYVQVEFHQSTLADAVALWAPASTPPVRVEICRAGSWSVVKAETTSAPDLDLRPAAIMLLKQAGISHLVVPFSSQGAGLLGAELVKTAAGWKLEETGNLGAAYLLRVR